MQLNVYKDYQTLSLYAAREIIAFVKNKPAAVLCLAAGDTPRLTYTLMAKIAVDENVDFKHCTFIGLDEWVGIPPDNEGSCHYFLQHQVFKPLHIVPSQIRLFNSLSENLAQECRLMDKVILEKGGIDLMVVGIGVNGHIGFNEPGIPVDYYSHIIDLDNTTQTVGQKYFQQVTPLKKGITLGLTHLLQSKRVILLANGTKKSEIIKRTLEEEINTDIPASIIRTHTNSIVMIDAEAASLLRKGQ